MKLLTKQKSGSGLALALAFALALGRCAMDTYSGGSGGETGNPVIRGNVVDSTGHPVSQMTISAIKSRFNPVEGNASPDSLTATSDSNGDFSIRVGRNDTFNILAARASSRLSGLATGIVMHGPVTDVPGIVARNPGAIRILLDKGIDTINGYVYIPGTTIFAPLSNSDSVVLAPVPAATIPSVYYSIKNLPSAARLISNDVAVMANRTATVSYYSWKSTEKLLLNTTGSGAGITGNVVAFPVLIRLTSANFDFSQAMKNGEDLRFAKSDNSPLSFEIERWDSANGRAEIWVKVDTVHGNDSTQYITMNWGNPQATAASNPGAVFDTAAGFQGVWHMSEQANSPALDATTNHYDGAAYNMVSAAGGNGAIGTGRKFDGLSSYITMPGTANSALAFAENGYYTVSAWIYADSLADSGFDVIAAKDLYPYQYILQIKKQDFEFSGFHSQLGAWQSSTSPATLKVWKYVVGVHNGARQYLFVDGTLTDSVGSLIATNASLDSAAADLAIGTDRHAPHPCFFPGTIDEVRISNVSRSADWTRLDYMNQRQNDALVVFVK
jgi:hypothetical protein